MTQTPVVSIARDGGIAVVTLDNPPVNALSHAARRGLWDATQALDADASVDAVVLITAGRTFIAGADISEFGKPPQEPHLPDLVGRLERAGKPWIAAIHGAALGGGLEIALGCSYRIAAAGARLGLPEVTLGVVPGAGGTVRLPRLIETRAAVEMITSGKPVAADRARALGLVDRIAEIDLRADALAFAREIAGAPKPAPLSDRPPVAPPGAEEWSAQEAAARKAARGAAAPLRALDCVRKAVEAPAAEAFAHERATFVALRDSAQAGALRHVFFAERAAAKPPEIAGAAARPLRSVGVVGGGTMGAGVAAALRDADLPVVLVERDAEAAARGRANLARLYDGAVKRGRLSPEARDARLAGATITDDYGALAEVDLAIEAVFEDLRVKRAVFAQLEAALRPDAVLATNTSYLDPNAIAEAVSGRDRFLGLHFFSPAHVMRLLEIIPAAQTAPDALATGFALAKRLGKTPVLSGICDGFIGNRILKTLRAQAERLLLAGSTPADVDRAMQAFGLPMGPFAAQDLGGLDIAAHQRRAARARGETAFAPVADRLVAQGRLGQKTGGGWYDYADGARTPAPSPDVAAAIADLAGGAGTGSALDDGRRADWILLPMIDEAARILDEGVARRAADIDLVQIHGYGFPRWRGGLMRYAEDRGLAEVLARLEGLAADGVAPPPSERLRRAAAQGGFSV